MLYCSRSRSPEERSRGETEREREAVPARAITQSRSRETLDDSPLVHYGAQGYCPLIAPGSRIVALDAGTRRVGPQGLKDAAAERRKAGRLMDRRVLDGARETTPLRLAALRSLILGVKTGSAL